MRLFIVVDMVNGFVNEGALSDKNINRIVPNIVAGVKKALSQGDVAIAFRDCHKMDDEEFKSYPPHCLKGSKESELIDELKPYEKQMIVIDKNTTNGFNTEEFKQLISSNHFSEIEICGCCSDICVTDLAYSLARYLSERKIDTTIKINENMIDTFNAPNHNADEVNRNCIDNFSKIGISIVRKGEERAKLKKVQKITDNKFLNMYIATYQTKKGELNYELVSRREIPDIVEPSLKVDAVNVLPYQYKDGKTVVYLIREFRFPLNDYIYEMPSGLIEDGEDGLTTAKRELQEGIGAKVISIERTATPAYTSCGLTDENIDFYKAEVEIGKQELDGFEDIGVIPVSLDELELLINSRKMGAQGKLQAKIFLQQEKIKALEKQLKELKGDEDEKI